MFLCFDRPVKPIWHQEPGLHISVLGYLEWGCLFELIFFILDRVVIYT